MCYIIHIKKRLSGLDWHNGTRRIVLKVQSPPICHSGHAKANAKRIWKISNSVWIQVCYYFLLYPSFTHLSMGNYYSLLVWFTYFQLFIHPPHTNLGGGHSEQVFLCGLVFGSITANALAYHEHKVLPAASKRHQVLIRVGHQQFLHGKGEHGEWWRSEQRD